MKSKSNSLFNIFMASEINVLTIHTSNDSFSSKATGDFDAADKQVLENNGYNRQSNGDYHNSNASINDVANAVRGCAENHRDEKPKVVKKEGDGSLLMRIIYTVIAVAIILYVAIG